MTINTEDGLVAGLTAGFRAPFWRTSMVLSTTQQAGSFWTVGGLPGAAATPPSGAGEAPTKDTAGALYFTNPAGGKLSYLAGVQMSWAANMSFVTLYDRLVHTSGLSGTSTSGQSVSSSAITRPDANGTGTELFLEWYTATGSTSTTATISYTNQSGTAGQSATATVPASCAAHQLVPVYLASGDTGVRSVQTVTLSASTLTAGNFGITIARRVVTIPGYAQGTSTTAGSTVLYDPFWCGLPQLYDSSCLWFAVRPSVASTLGPMYGHITVAQG